MAVADPYRVLQVLSTADQEVLNAAFRALAHKYHPDKDSSDLAARRMSELNAAWAMVRDPELRANWDRGQRRAAYGFESTMDRRGSDSVPPPPRGKAAGTKLEFGRYTGWALRDLARQDPDYLRWLSRHASGLRYRTEIYQILGRMGTSAA
ncbi:MAG TPA: DnaJ domain-containing protein [Candidatus Limnocylindria bacterium]|nr:DnaJ domain-containing protein [Candidatus Limnocylindria bacterium]